jgi:hypothetical protein
VTANELLRLGLLINFKVQVRKDGHQTRRALLSRNLVKAFPSLPPRVKEQHGQEQVDQFVRHKNTAENRDDHRPEHVGARTAGPQERRQAEYGDGFGEELRPQSMHCTLEHCFAELIEVRGYFIL